MFLKLSSYSHNPDVIRNTCDEGRVRFDKRTEEKRRGSLDENTKQIRRNDRNGWMHPLKWKQLDKRINNNLQGRVMENAYREQCNLVRDKQHLTLRQNTQE